MPGLRRHAAPPRRPGLAPGAALLAAACTACAGAAPTRPPAVDGRALAGRALAWVRDTAAERAAAGASLRGVRAVDARVAWASGSRGTVLRTADSGRTWRRVGPPDAAALDLRSVWAFDSLRAVVASAGDGAEGQARIYRTTNGGRSWTLALSDTTKGVFLDAVAFWPDGRHGLALSDPVGGAFVVFASEDGGATWRRTPREGMPAMRDGEAAFAAGNAALTVAGTVDAWFVTGGPNGARVHVTRTGGARWDAVDAPVTPRTASAGLFAIAMRDALVGVALGGDYQQARTGTRQIAVTRDGGRSWEPGDLGGGAPGYWSGAAHVPGTPDTFLAVGLAGTARTDDAGRTWAIVDTTALHAVSAARGGAVWAVGPRGTVLHGRW